jgi:hypothetical protein
MDTAEYFMTGGLLMKTRGMNSFFRLLLVLSVLLILSGCLTLYCCRERYVTVAKDGKGATIGYRFKNFGTNDINGYTIYVAVGNVSFQS